MQSLVRRVFPASAAVVLSLIAACAPAASPSPTSAPAKPAATMAPANAAGQTPTEKPASGAQSDEPEIKDLKVGIIPVAALTPPIVAKKLGYFDEEGFTNVEFTTLGGGAELLPAVEAGRIDLALSAYYSVFLARQQGFDFWIATNNDSATSGPTDGYAIVVRSDSPIQTVKNLEGRRVATNTVPSLGMGYLAGTMNKQGADYKQVNFVEIGFPQMPDALLNDQVDAIAAIEPSHTVAVSSGQARAIAYPYVEVHPGVDLGGFIATQRWLRQNPNTVRKFERALSRGMAYMNEDQARARNEVMEYTKINPEVVEKMHLPVWSTKADPQEVQMMADLMLELGILNQKLDVASFIWPTALQQ